MDRRQAIVALIVVQVLFGIWPVLAKSALVHLTPLALAAIRTLFAALAMVALHRWLARRRFPVRRHWRPLLLFTLLAVLTNQVLYVIGLGYTTAVNATLVIATIPAMTYGVAVATGRESLGPRRAAGLALALAGIVVLMGGFGPGAWGDFLVWVNSLAFAVFLVVAKPYMVRHDAFSLTTAMFVAGALVLVPVGLLVDAPAQATAMPASAWLIVAAIVVGPTLLTYVLNAKALGAVPATTVAAFIYIQPLVAAVAAWFWLDEVPSWRVVPAAALVFGGVTLIARRQAAQVAPPNA